MYILLTPFLEPLLHFSYTNPTLGDMVSESAGIGLIWPPLCEFVWFGPSASDFIICSFCDVMLFPLQICFFTLLWGSPFEYQLTNATVL